MKSIEYDRGRITPKILSGLRSCLILLARSVKSIMHTCVFKKQTDIVIDDWYDGALNGFYGNELVEGLSQHSSVYGDRLHQAKARKPL